MATCPEESGVANAGASPPELTVDIALLKSPFSSIRKDCKAPGEFSFVALLEISIGPSVVKEMNILEDAVVRWMESYPGRVVACLRLACQSQNVCVRVEDISRNEGGVSSSNDSEVDHDSGDLGEYM